MLNPTPNETSRNLYESVDGQVVVRILDDPQRFPCHEYKTAVIRCLPKAYTRIRNLEIGVVELMLCKEELLVLRQAVEQCDPDFKVEFKRPMVNKPMERKAFWDRYNKECYNNYRGFNGYRRSHRFRRR